MTKALVAKAGAERARSSLLNTSTMGTDDGSIIAAIITTHALM
jgi:hypothetical protein